jgi:predicted transcriptional regulator
MEVHFTPDTEAKLAQVAAEHHTGAAEYVEQLVEHYLDHDRWFRAQVQEGLDQLDQGQFVSHEDVGARIARLFHS